MICPFCRTEIPDQARKCRQCRAWLLKPGEKIPDSSPDKPPTGTEMPAPAPAPQIQYVPVPVPQYAPPPPQPPAPPRDDSVVFAVFTMLALIFAWPIGVLMNIIGIFTGPKRGCFVALFAVFVLPVLFLVFVLVLGDPTGIGWIDDMIYELHGGRPNPK